jgi:hypothetical protein
VSKERAFRRESTSHPHGKASPTRTKWLLKYPRQTNHRLIPIQQLRSDSLVRIRRQPIPRGIRLRCQQQWARLHSHTQYNQPSNKIPVSSPPPCKAPRSKNHPILSSLCFPCSPAGHGHVHGDVQGPRGASCDSFAAPPRGVKLPGGAAAATSPAPAEPRPRGDSCLAPAPAATRTGEPQVLVE